MVSPLFSIALLTVGHIINRMRKLSIISGLLLLLLSVGVTSCKQKLQETKGVVTHIEGSKLGDTLKAMRVVSDGDTLLFSLKDAEYNDGIMVIQDSVTVSYIKGDGDTLRALLVSVKPQPAHVVDLDSLKKAPLKTR